MLDENITSESGASSPGADVSSASVDTNSGALAAATGEGSSAPAGTQADVSTSDAANTMAPAADEFAKYEPPSDANLEQIRQAHRELLNDHRSFKQSAQALDPWKPFIEQYQTPEDVQPLLEIAHSLFTPLIENGVQVFRDGMPATTTLPAIQRLAEQSPQTLIQLSEELANFQIQGSSIIDWQLQGMGLNPANIEKYIEWEKSGGPSVATTGGEIDADDLQAIPAEFREAFKSLPASSRADILLMEEGNRDFFLQTVQDRLETQKFQQTYQQQEEQKRQDFQRQQQQEIAAAQETAVTEAFSSTFKSLMDDLASKGWNPSADSKVNSLQHGLVLIANLAATSPTVAPLMLPLFEAAGVKVDAPKIESLINQVDQYSRSAISYERHGDAMQAKQAAAARDRAQFQLKALTQGVSAQIIGILDGTINERRQADESRISGAASRFVPSGQATNGGGNGNPYALPPGVKPYTPEAAAFKASLVTQQ